MKYEGNILLPEDVKYIIDRITDAGFEAYAVGGCVRDSILGINPEDWDIATSASPALVKSCFKRTVDTGIKHGTVTVLLDKKGYEVTTYRIDGSYTDRRHPDKVEFSSSLEEDLKRRDFTINAMAYSHKKGFVDLFGGIEDLNMHRIRCVGSSEERFYEDALRMLRAIRFSAQLGFEIEESTYFAIRKLSSGLSNVSKERIFAELNKALLSGQPWKLTLLLDLGLAEYISSFFGELEKEDFDKLRLSSKIPAKKNMRWAALLCGREGEFAKKLLRMLKSDNETIEKVGILVSYIKKYFRRDKEEIKKLLGEIGVDNARDLFILKKSGVFHYQNKEEDIAGIEALINDIIDKKEAYTIKMLALSGYELMDMGIAEGPFIGEVLKMLLEKVINRPERNRKDELMEIAKEYIINKEKGK